MGPSLGCLRVGQLTMVLSRVACEVSGRRRRKTMRFRTWLVVKTCVLAFGCSGAADSENVMSESGEESARPSFSAEDEAIRQRFAASEIASIDVPHGTLGIYEIAPGEFVTKQHFPDGAEPTHVPEGLELVELYRALAPGRTVPSSVLDAARRAEDARNVAAPEAQSLLSGENVLRAPVMTEGPPVRLLAESTIPLAAFQELFCIGYAGPHQHKWCRAAAVTGTSERAYTHIARGVVCADTGAVHWRLLRSNAEIDTDSIVTGFCAQFSYHGLHDFWGTNLKRTIEMRIEWAEETVRFAGYFKSAHQFTSEPPGY
jgi:hypothetical protein